MPKNTQPGFSIVELVLVLIVITALALIGFAYINHRQSPAEKTSRQTQDCGNFKLANDTVKFDQIEAVTPPGSIIAGSLKAHSYINFKSRQTNIIAPTNMTLVAGAKYTQPEAEGKIQYLLDFEADCGYMVRYDHISHPNKEIAEQLSGTPSQSTHVGSLDSIDYAAGSTIGSTDGNGVQRQFDFGVYKDGVNNVFASDERYIPYIESDIHTTAVCPYDLYSKTKSKQYYKLFSVTDEHPQPDILCHKY